MDNNQKISTITSQDDKNLSHEQCTDQVKFIKKISKKSIHDDPSKSFILTWKNLQISVKKDGKKIIENLTGSFESGKLIGVIGASGCGKTTLLNCLSGFTRDDLVTKGDLSINNQPIKTLKTLKQITGYVLQQDILLPELTVAETLMFQAKLKLPSSCDHDQSVEHVIKLMN